MRPDYRCKKHDYYIYLVKGSNYIFHCKFCNNRMTFPKWKLKHLLTKGEGMYASYT